MKKEKTLDDVFDRGEPIAEDIPPKPKKKRAVKEIDLDKEKLLCEQKLQIIQRLKDARVKRGAAPKESEDSAKTPIQEKIVEQVANTVSPPVETPVTPPVATPVAPPVVIPTVSVPINIPQPPKKIVYCTFKKPIWG